MYCQRHLIDDCGECKGHRPIFLRERETDTIICEIPEDHWALKKKNGRTIFCSVHLEEYFEGEQCPKCKKIDNNEMGTNRS